MTIPGNLLTTAMGVMPHRDVERAIEAAMSLDVPFWPQLPLLSYREDMYVQASEHFPGIVLDMKARTLGFSMDRFVEEAEEVLARFDDPAWFDVSEGYSQVYHRFLELDLSGRPAIRGQIEGPVSFGFNVLDQDERPILFDDTVRPFMLEFLARRVNAQLARLKQCNRNAFMFVDEPGLQFVFSAMSGYADQAARTDMETFLSMIDRPRGIHLCGNPDWDFLLEMDMEVLSLDAYTNAEVVASYAPSIRRYLERGGSIVWGIVPSNVEPFTSESVDSLEQRLEGIWNALQKAGMDRELLIARSMLSPATCCLVNPDGERTVEKAFRALTELSARMRERMGLA
ncbi:MAG: hypothetical protein JRG91_10235 [Deltaproteobacteria bacterium]|nr:hypothetical protein [Deltaproteobacteria bacterium]